MGFNKIILPEKKRLIEHLKDNGSSRFYLTYIHKMDSMIGPSDSTIFIKDFMEKYNQSDLKFFEI